MKQIRVLVVDDSVVVRKMVSMHFRSAENIQIIGSCNGGLQALDWLHSNQVDLIILDVEMPGMNGVQALKLIREHHPEIQILMFSALNPAQASLTLEALAEGAADYITKPSSLGGAGALQTWKTLEEQIQALFYEPFSIPEMFQKRPELEPESEEEPNSTVDHEPFSIPEVFQKRPELEPESEEEPSSTVDHKPSPTLKTRPDLIADSKPTPEIKARPSSTSHSKPTSAVKIRSSPASSHKPTSAVKIRSSPASSRKPNSAVKARPSPSRSRAPLQKPKREAWDLWVIGSSTGGPKALQELLESLPGPLPVPALIVQHMPPVFTQCLAERLSKKTGLEVKEASDGDFLQAGSFLLAPGGYHMRLKGGRSEPRVLLDQGPEINFVRPAVDALLPSVQRLYGARCLVTILTGMGRDGCDGCFALHEQGATILAQDKASSVVWGMPGAVASLSPQLLSPREMGPWIYQGF